MLYSGVSWSAKGFEVEVVDADGRHVSPPVAFGAGRTGEIVSYLRDLGPRLVTVVESTNGILDGQLMTAGLDVYRADPWVLPERPLFGSVPAGALARAAQQNLSALTRLERNRGTQTGRENDLINGFAATAARVQELDIAGRLISHGDRDRREIALTFDDGPQPPYTGQVLDVLERYGVPAAFFCVGLYAGGHSEDIIRIREQGHELANHTWSHPILPDLTRPQLVEQVDRTREIIAEVSGGPLPAFFRPPYGSRSVQVMDWLSEMESMIVLWDVETDDWSMPGADIIAQRVLDQAQPGSIVLMHDGGGDRSQTVAALPVVIEGLLARGYTFVQVEDLVKTRYATKAK